MTDVLSEETAALRDVIAERVRESIVTGVLQPGDRLREDDLCSRYGASRLPVREALARLQTEGFVAVTKFRGASVAVPSAETGLELVRVRQTLEGLAAELAARVKAEPCADELRAVLAQGQAAVQSRQYAELPMLVESFHALIATAGGNAQLALLLEQVRFKMRWVFHANLPQRAAECWSEHDEILQAILAGFPGLARELIERHVAADAAAFEALPQAP
ncbi:MAG: hypothetical protein QOI42_155 [Frankiaceae bacterium]|nr:hypothetical protein [Frankiaceae bacterium]